MDTTALTPEDQKAFAAQQGDPNLPTPGMPEGSPNQFNFKKLMQNLAGGLSGMSRGAQGLAPVASPRDPYGSGSSEQPNNMIDRLKNFPSTISNLWH
jgi:hypothetical protein